MQPVPRELELLIGQIAAAAESFNPGLRVSCLPDAAGEQYVLMLSLDGVTGEVRLPWNILRNASPDMIRSILTSKLPSHRQIFRATIEGVGEDLRLRWKEGIA